MDQVSTQSNLVHLHRVTDATLGHAMRLGSELHSLGALNVVPIDRSYLLQRGRAVMHDPQWFAYLAYTEHDEYCGVMVGHVAPFFFSPQLSGYEDMLYVRDGVRNRAKIAISLIRAFVAWAMNDMGCVMVQSGDIAAINSIAVDAIYRRCGFKRYGIIYQYGGET